MRWVKTTVIFLMLIALPALSWFYLRQGANWRISGLEAMSEKIPVKVPDGGFETVNNRLIEMPESGFIIASNLDVNSPGADSVLDKLADQFSHRSDLTYLYFNEAGGGLAEEWNEVNCASAACKDFMNQLFANGKNTAFIDDSMYLRRTYDLNDRAEVLKLVEHAAILLPVESRPKIELKRGKSE